ncbi:hypothetical protein [Acidianus brierleyi]|uniref:Uncharacterized protein n=1 Tax=Acidianus brierleyi TaxID=41673 RepID=A0A2U9IHI3_9CREN|nr:hypothetical protein [Acidianus brierleyi]AWR95502.1 hypothetical protein DFR85_13780 [Acidianus brierleyi]
MPDVFRVYVPPPWYATLWPYFLTIGIIMLLSSLIDDKKIMKMINVIKEFIWFLIDHLGPFLD